MPTARKNLLLVLSTGILLSGCAPGSGLRPAPPYDPTVYQLGTDDEVRVITYGQDQLTGDFRIDGAGQIDVPLVGNLQAAGLTTHELADQLRADLHEKGILRDANIAVQVTAYRLVSIIGEVARPGQYAYQPGMTMLSAVAAAGGFTYRSWQKSAYVVRQEDGHVVVGKLQPQTFVKPGDMIKIYERHF